MATTAIQPVTLVPLVASIGGMQFRQFGRTRKSRAAGDSYKHCDDCDDAPAKANHNPCIDDSAPRLGELPHCHDNGDDASVDKPRDHKPFAGRVKQGHAEERSEDDV